RLCLETLEVRLAPVVNASLTNGVLNVALSAADDKAVVSHAAGVIQVVDPVANRVVSNFTDSLVKSIDAHGGSLPGQAVTFTSTVSLEEELKTSGLPDVTINGIYSAKAMELKADQSFTLGNGGVLSTRKIQEGVDPLTAPSLGNSGDIAIE